MFVCVCVCIEYIVGITYIIILTICIFQRKLNTIIRKQIHFIILKYIMSTCQLNYNHTPTKFLNKNSPAAFSA